MNLPPQSLITHRIQYFPGTPNRGKIITKIVSENVRGTNLTLK